MNINIDFRKLWPFGNRDRVLFTKSQDSHNGFLATHFAKTGTGRYMTCIPWDQGEIEFSINEIEVGTEPPGLAVELIAKIGEAKIAIDAFGDTKDASRAMRMIMCAMRRSNPTWKRYWWPLLVGISAFMLLPPMAQVMTAKVKEIENGGQASQQVFYAQPQQPSSAIAAQPQQSVALKPGSISLDGAIHYGNKNGKTLYVFSDPQCPYCRDQEKELAALEKDYSIYVFPTPFKDGSPQIVKAVLCNTGDPAGIWRKIMSGADVRGLIVDPVEDCKESRFAEANLNAFRMLGLSATPTLISGEGLVNPGYMTANEIRAWAK